MKEKSLTTLAITLMMLIREKKQTGYAISNRVIPSHQIVYKILRQLHAAGVLTFEDVKNDGKPDSKFYAHALSDEEQIKLISSSLLNMRINSTYAAKDISAVSLCVGFVDQIVIEKWVSNFVEFQGSIINVTKEKADKFGHVSDYEIRYRKFLISEAMSLVEPNPGDVCW